MRTSHISALLLGAALANPKYLWLAASVMVAETAYYTFQDWWERYIERLKALEQGDSRDGRTVIGGFERE